LEHHSEVVSNGPSLRDTPTGEAIHDGELPGVGSLTEPDPGAQFDAFAHICCDLLDRSAPIQHVLASAATVDAEAADLLEIIRRQRLVGQSRIVRVLANRDALADGLAEPEAADIVYTLMSPELHRILTVERGWSADRYEQWLAAALRALLLPR
jgi:hypothetical protein